ncbi:MAG: UDP-N-acetylmuramoyl-L-alanine--D-glutamate ligase [Hyphomicrobiaceae bacterium]
MIRATTWAGRRVAVFGLGRSGNATCRALVDGGAEVSAWDDGEAARAETARQGFTVVDLAAADWSTFAALVLAPGVPLTHPAPHWTVERANAAGVPVIGDVELFFRERRATGGTAPVIAITGTNGKSTVTALTTHLLTAMGCDVAMGGNIGTAVLSLPDFAPDRIYVLELSSFQIDLTPSLAPTVGILINLAPDHIDRHGTMEHYAAVKARLVESADLACIGVDDAHCRAIVARLPSASVIPFSVAARGTRFDVDGGELRSDGRAFADWSGIPTLRGLHNAQNALAASAALQALAQATGRAVWQPGAIATALRTYPGLPHRMEEVGRLDRVLFVNDSKATNADSTDKALAAFPGGIHWILGGKPKEGGITTLAPYFPRIAKAYLIGAAAEEFAATLGTAVPHVVSGTLDAALAEAAADAAANPAAEPVVLLSPACASYDQFKSFEHRGDAFRTLVRRMIADGAR